MEFVIAKGRFSFRLTAPYTEERRVAASRYAREHNRFRKQIVKRLAKSDKMMYNTLVGAIRQGKGKAENSVKRWAVMPTSPERG